MLKYLLSNFEREMKVKHKDTTIEMSAILISTKLISQLHANLPCAKYGIYEKLISIKS